MSGNDVYDILPCPHCYEQIQIYRAEHNCCIFRHGVYKQTHHQIPPHAPKEECDRLVSAGAIFGCGKPFRVVRIFDSARDHMEIQLEICDYI